MAVEWDTAGVSEAIRRGIMVGVVASTELVHDVATLKIQSPPKTGRVYTRRGVKHQASAPGEAPATDLGTLVSSGSTRYRPEELLGQVNWSAQHASFLEQGTERMEPRPFARPSLDECQEQIVDNIAAGVSDALAGYPGLAT